MKGVCEMSIFTNENINIKDPDLTENVINIGYSKIPSLLTVSEIEMCKQEIDRYIEENVGSNKVWIDQYLSDHRIMGFEKVSNFAMSFKMWAIPFFEKLYGTPVEAKVLAQRVDPTENNQGSGGGWHRDSLRSQFKAFLYFNQIDSETGPFGLIPQSNKTVHKIKESILVRGIPNITKPECNKESEVKIHAQAGDVVFADTSIVHRGSPGLRKVRYNFTIYAFKKGKFPSHIRDLSI